MIRSGRILERFLPAVELSRLRAGQDVRAAAVSKRYDVLKAMRHKFVLRRSDESSFEWCQRHLLTERLYPFRRERGRDVAEAEAPGAVGPQGKDFVVLCDEQCLIAQVAEDAGQANSTKEVLVQQREESPA